MVTMMIDYSYNPKLTELKKVIHHFEIRSYRAKQLICKQGEKADTLFFMVKGAATVSIKDNNKNMIIHYLNTGDFFGELALFDRFNTEAIRTANIHAKVASEIALIPYTKFYQLAEKHTDLLYIIADQMASRLQQTTRKVTGLTSIDTAGRIARALLDLCKQPDAITHPDGMQVRITRQDLGNIVGCSREMVGRVLKDMEGQGLISVSGRSIVVFGTR